MRLLGIGMLSLSLLFVSFQAIAEMDRHIRKKELAYFLWCDIVNLLEFTRKSPSEIFLDINRGKKYRQLEFLSETCELLEKEELFHIAYAKSLGAHRDEYGSMYMSLLQAGEVIGSTNLQAQLERLGFFCSELKGQLAVAQAERGEKARLYRSLGAAGSAFVFIMLI